MNESRFEAYLNSGKSLILDGGLSNQLEAQGNDLQHSLWSASLIKDKEEDIIKAHLAYLEAGANCVISSTYQASVIGFIEAGFEHQEACQLIKKSVELGRTAIDQHVKNTSQNNPSAFLAASIGPYGAFLADGSEYHGNYGVDDKLLKEFHKERLEILDKTTADVLACETIPSIQEARVLRDCLTSVTKPAWICFSCQDGKQLNDGTAIEEVVKLFDIHPTVIAVGVNCTSPQYIQELILRIKKTSGKTIIVYPNSGEHYHADTKEWSGTASPLECAKAAEQWRQGGAQIIGGCCRMGPEHIRQIVKVLK